MEQTAAPLAAPDLQRMSALELDVLFRQAPAGPVPQGDADGTVLAATGHRAGQPLARFVRAVAWQGKLLLSDGTLVNKVTPFGLHAVRAVVGQGPSWVDGKECIVIDYARTSVVARWVRDEIRLVAPHLYLGVVWFARRRVASFALTFDDDDDGSGGSA
jgi:hypothetical protein